MKGVQKGITERQMPTLKSNSILSIESVSDRKNKSSLYLDFDRESRNYLETIYHSIENFEEGADQIRLLDLGHDDFPHENAKMRNTLAGFFLERQKRRKADNGENQVKND